MSLPPDPEPDHPLSEQPVDPRTKLERKTKPKSINLYEGDWKILAWLAGYLGCSENDAMRTALRSFAAQMQQFDKRTPTSTRDAEQVAAMERVTRPIEPSRISED